MKSLDGNLYIRNGSYYYRSALPRELHSLLPFKEIVFSLKQKDQQLARFMCAQIKYQESQYLQSFNYNQQLQSASLNSQSHDLKKLITELSGLKEKFCPSNRGRIVGVGSSKIINFTNIATLYLEDCTSNSKYTLQIKQKSFELFEDLIGDLAITDIKIEEARRYKQLLSKIPPNAKKILKVEKLSDIDWSKFEGDKQNPKTINNRLSCMVALFNWAIRHGYYHERNPFSGLMIKLAKQSSNKRQAYTKQDLITLFKSPIYMGCAGTKWNERFEEGDLVHKDSLYWVPLIGLYSGMRLNEICQLYIEDIQEEDGIHYFDVNNKGEDKALKNLSSQRKVVIHQRLLDLSFFRHVQQLKQKGEQRLFPDIPLGSGRTYSYIFSKRYIRLLEALDLRKNGLCFHSFRHTFIDGLRSVEVERQIAMVLTGHQSSKDVHDSYGSGYSLGVLQENINRLSFPEIEKG